MQASHCGWVWTSEPGAIGMESLSLCPDFLKDIEFPAFGGFRDPLGGGNQIAVRLRVFLEKRSTAFAIVAHKPAIHPNRQVEARTELHQEGAATSNTTNSVNGQKTGDLARRQRPACKACALTCPSGQFLFAERSFSLVSEALCNPAREKKTAFRTASQGNP